MPFHFSFLKIFRNELCHISGCIQYCFFCFFPVHFTFRTPTKTADMCLHTAIPSLSAGKPSLLPQVGQKKIGQATPLFARTFSWLVSAFSFAFRNNSSDIIGSCAFSTTIHSSLSLETNLLLPVLATLFLFQIIFPRYTSFLSISEIVVTDQSFFSFSFSLCHFITFSASYTPGHVSTWVSFRYFAICPLVSHLPPL